MILTAALPASAEGEEGLEALLDDKAKVEKLAGDMKFVEGPVWDAQGFLLYSDIPANTIFKWSPGGTNEIFRRPSGNSNGLTLDREGRLIACEHGNRRVSRTEKDGTVVTLAEKYGDKRLNSPNDLDVKSDGSIYFTDPPYGIRKEQQELEFNGVYRIAPDGTLTLLVKDFVRPNGIAFSPDENRLYVADSDPQVSHIRVFDVQADGTLSNGRVFAELKEPSQNGVPDGMKVDAEGNVFSTGPGGVWVFAPDGKLLGKIAVPEVPANLAWGGNDYKTLYITAQTGLYRIRLKTTGLKPGGVKMEQ
ncbi:MAG: SMP-30/gluconolactonase/LRE family protein [Armatimonadota bacterium]|nr:SMP-30/gluconolactonase/LRE family protein [Armatimonadota bacterium]